jgi:hypothetical protein
MFYTQLGNHKFGLYPTVGGAQSIIKTYPIIETYSVLRTLTQFVKKLNGLAPLSQSLIQYHFLRCEFVKLSTLA